jgi:hypothetical protein
MPVRPRLSAGEDGRVLDLGVVADRVQVVTGRGGIALSRHIVHRTLRSKKATPSSFRRYQVRPKTSDRLDWNGRAQYGGIKG